MPRSHYHDPSIPTVSVSRMRLRRRPLLVAVALLAPVAYLAWHTLRAPVSPRPSEAAPSDAIARVGGTPITATELRDAWAKCHQNTDEDASSAVAATLEDLVRRELLFAEARSTGFAERDDVRKAWKAFVVKRYREELDARQSAAASVTEEAIADHYREHTRDFTLPERRRLAVLHVPMPPGAASERRTRQEQEVHALRERAILQSKHLRHFGDLAATYSAHVASKRDGGDLGWLTRSQADRAWPRSVGEAAFALTTPGEITPVVATEEGWFLIKLIERQEGRPESLDSVRERIRRQLVRQRENEATTALFQELRSRHAVEVYAERVAALELPASAKTGSSLAQHPPSVPTP